MRRALLLLTVAAAPACAPSAMPPYPTDGTRVVGYYFQRSATRGYLPGDIPAGSLTHVNYAFAHIAADGTLTYGDRCLDLGECGEGEAPAPGWPGAFAGLLELKARHPHLRVLVSIGGWGGSARFSDVALTEDSRRVFVRSALERFLDARPGVFDGFDVDWEYPVAGGEPDNARRPEDRVNFTRLLEEFRRQLDARAARDGRSYLLTVATAAGPRHLENLEPGRIQALVDWINVMTYDYHTGDSIAHFNAPLHSPPGDPTPGLSIDATVRAYLAAGVEPGMIVLGVPFFARGYGGVAPADDGLFQPVADPPPDGWGVGGLRYRELADARRRGFERHWSRSARVPWLYNPGTGVWISYDDPRSLAAKATYVRERGLGGVMIWELSGDDGSLLAALLRSLSRGGGRRH